MTVSPQEELAAALARAVHRRIISAEQAAAIVAAEGGTVGGAPVAAPRTGRGAASAVEALGYVGGIIGLVGAALLVGQFWDELGPAPRLAILGATAAAFTVAGFLVHEEASPALWRLQGFLWLLGSGAIAFAGGICAFDVFDLEAEPGLVMLGVVLVAHGGALWRFHDRPAQHVTCLGGLILAAAAATASVADSPAVGVVVVAVGALWAIVGGRDVLPPRRVALAGGGAAALVGAGMTSDGWNDVAPVFGLAVGAVLLVAGIVADEFVLTVLGAGGLFVYVPWTVTHFFADTLGVPLVMMVCGVALVGLTVLLIRRAASRSAQAIGP